MGKFQDIIDAVYLPAMIQGLWITTHHLVKNLFFHALHAVGLAKKQEAMVTICYPEVRNPLPPAARTRHRLTTRADGTPRCVACMMCATACPSDCIFIEAGEHPNPVIEKFPVRFDIDESKCVFCGFCVEACPEDAIRMDSGIVEMAWHDRRGMIFDRNYLMDSVVAIPEGDTPAKTPLAALRRRA